MQKQFSALNFVALLTLFWATSVWSQATKTPATSPAPATQPSTAQGTVNPADTPAQPAAPMPQMASSSVAPDYRIGPGDSLQIFVWRNPELTQTVPVRPDGKISTPLVEDMVAVGKTPSQLARDIEGVLSEYIRSPQVNVIVTNPVSAFSQVKVIGQVTNPQSLPYREGMRVLDAILASGGLTEFAAGNRGKIVRKVDGKDTELRVKVEDLVNKGAMKYNLELRPGDVIVVPQSFF
ncbi:XrtA/PEP-CTERM system exopolysaccharide export protein [Steroidobacter sp.]|uniref:XrtA/PEP-CTERM system exopolysaccharide export protein n=1 Tax=Steroidobacter sp. TaxID=1978227 RepID=UPI001A4FCA15|nr:XrtA/PEP-CTERM system exopolysaccharide export protein [Steroidobacter sp.]MBL8266091.1 polysaccharide biosynthesis/export family protein [Steroidobacter sp.]